VNYCGIGKRTAVASASKPVTPTGEGLAQTTTKCAAWRMMLLAVALLMRNLWVWRNQQVRQSSTRSVSLCNSINSSPTQPGTRTDSRLRRYEMPNLFRVNPYEVGTTEECLPHRCEKCRMAVDSGRGGRRGPAVADGIRSMRGYRYADHWQARFLRPSGGDEKSGRWTSTVGGKARRPWRIRPSRNWLIERDACRLQGLLVDLSSSPSCRPTVAKRAQRLGLNRQRLMRSRSTLAAGSAAGGFSVGCGAKVSLRSSVAWDRLGGMGTRSSRVPPEATSNVRSNCTAIRLSRSINVRGANRQPPKIVGHALQADHLHTALLAQLSQQVARSRKSSQSSAFD